MASPIDVFRDLTDEHQRGGFSSFYPLSEYGVVRRQFARYTHNFILPKKVWPVVADYFITHESLSKPIDSNIDIQHVSEFLLNKYYEDLQCAKILYNRTRCSIVDKVNELFLEFNLLWDLIKIRELTPAAVACLPTPPPTLEEQIITLRNRVQELENAVYYAPGSILVKNTQASFEQAQQKIENLDERNTDSDALDADL